MFKYNALLMYSLMVTTRELLLSDKRSLMTIFVESGIPFFWLCKFKDGKIKDPSVNKVQALYEFLTKHSLNV